MNLLSTMARSLLRTSGTGREYLRLRALRGYLSGTGWFRSVEEGLPVDAAGSPLPWYTYPAIRFLEDRIHPGLRVFEYGSGNSTRWWSAHVGSVVACEHDPHWHQLLAPQLPAHVDYRLCPLEPSGDYCQLVATFPAEFDVVVIDGRDRVHCARHALTALKQGGVIIWDNTERDAYREGYADLRARGFRRIDFWGLGPINRDHWCTSVFYRDGNALGI